MARWRRGAYAPHLSVVCLTLGAGLLIRGGWSSSAEAVPPPPDRAPIPVEAATEEGDRVAGEVRPYDPVTFEVAVPQAMLLELRLDDAGGTLSVALESPSSGSLVEGARHGADGMTVRLAEAGVWRIRVSMAADAARAGRSAKFTLFLRLRSVHD